MDKIACPHCGEKNYAASKLCWACGKPMSAPVAAAPEPAPPQPPAAEPAAPPAAAVDEEGLKPAEREARALRDREFVTPPVDVEERPHNLGGWIAYSVAAVAASGQTFREALDDYDRRRGRPSGAMSSYGCLVIAFVLVALAALFYYVVPPIMMRR